MARNSPCFYCKQRRRKCEKLHAHEPCQRCIKMKRKCIPQDIHYKEQGPTQEEQEYNTESHVGNHELDYLYGQVKGLEQQLHSLELDLIQEKALIQSEPRWDINVVNGELRLETDIKSLEDLMLYGKAAIRYLSPFRGIFQSKSLAFGRINTSFFKIAMQLVVKTYDNIDPGSLFSPKSISKRFSTGRNTTCLEPQLIVRSLVDNYFSCFNDTVPILHEPSFMEYLESIDDPMQDTVVMAVCACSSISSCKHNFLNSHEKRSFSEYFYEICMNKLIDMFDDPEKALESLLVINLLLPVMLATLRIAESYKWASIALLLCNTLQNQNPEWKHGGPHLPRMTRIKCAIIHRNSALTEHTMSIIDFIEHDIRNQTKSNSAKFDILPDETGRTRNILQMFNLMMDLSLHPAFIAVVTLAQKLAVDEVAELSFEEIIQYEEAIVEWWHNLPSQLKMCTEPFDLTKEIIEKETDVYRILMAYYMHVITMCIQCCLIQPKSKENIEDVYNINKDRGIRLAMHSADMCLLLMKQIDHLGTFCYSPTKLLVRTIDSLMSLLQVPDETMAQMAKLKLNEYMQALKQKLAPDHQVSQAVSPYSIITVAPPGSIPPVTELYKNYPLPGEALIFDILRTLVEQNTGNIVPST